MSDTDITSRSAFADGVRAVAPMLLGVIPFGLIVGVSASTAVMGTAPAWATSLVIFGGAAQLATIELTNAGTAAAVVIATGLVISARHLMYSASLADHFREFPAGWRYGLPYLMTDQAYAVSITRYATVDDPMYKRWFFLGAGLALWTPWQLTTATGVLVGAQIPSSWSLDFVIPLVFMVLVIGAVKDRPGLIAAVVGAVVAVAGRGLPYNTGLLAAAACGIAAGVVAERWKAHP
jgi:4-azaleucine resistance transporter AzlC